MSWDLDCYGKIDGERFVLAEFNYTHNTNPMIRAAGCPWSSDELNGITSPQLVAVLEPALAEMEANPDKYIAMNPPNGWGSYETLMPVLRQVLAVAKRFPSGKWRASF
ncbi:MAG TPA: hypothetical protein VM487_02700 [Phycisphaerae bacterium]|nr:hypothetical protein [Phycisphaerae bacterium]